MKRIFAVVSTLLTLLLPSLVQAKDAMSGDPKQNLVTITEPSIYQPLYPAFYWIIYLGILAMAAFLIWVLVRGIRMWF